MAMKGAKRGSVNPITHGTPAHAMAVRFPNVKKGTPTYKKMLGHIRGIRSAQSEAALDAHHSALFGLAFKAQREIKTIHIAGRKNPIIGNTPVGAMALRFPHVKKGTPTYKKMLGHIRGIQNARSESGIEAHHSALFHLAHKELKKRKAGVRTVGMSKVGQRVHVKQHMRKGKLVRSHTMRVGRKKRR